MCWSVDGGSVLGVSGFLFEPRFEFSSGAFAAVPGGEFPPVPEVAVALHRADAAVIEEQVVEGAFLNVVEVREGLAGKEHRVHRA